MRIGDIERGKEEIYGGIKRESERRQILADYQKVEDAYNKFVSKEIAAADVSRLLGASVIGIGGEHPAAQIYAYELLLKSLAETETPEDENKIIDEAVFDVALENRPVKREYLLGLLAHFTSKELLEARQKEPRGGAAPAEEQKIYSAFQNYLTALTPDRSKDLPQEMKDIAGLISNDFPKISQDGEIARLVAKYYSKEAHATAPPGPKRSMIVDIFSQQSAGLGGSGKPERIYVLPPGLHTSNVKIQEAEQYGLPMLTEIAQIQDTALGREKKALLWDISSAESLAYIKKLRELKDQRDFEGAKEFMGAYRQKLWDQLDDGTRRELGGEVEEVEILAQTIRDESAAESSFTGEKQAKAAGM